MKVCKVYNPYLSNIEVDYLSMCEDLRGNVIKREIIDYTCEKLICYCTCLSVDL